MSAEIETAGEQSWRSIRQVVNPRTMTSQGRRRLGWILARATFSLFLLGGLAALGVYLYRGFETPARTLAPVVRDEPLEEIVVITDGVLSRTWVADRLSLPAGIPLMAVDLDRAKLVLEREGQVRVAVITRDFPGTLVVTLEERVPVLRALVPLEGGRREALFVARDGVVYRGFEYDPKMVAGLPWMDGVRLTRSGSGFAPVVGVDRASELIVAAHAEAPHLAAEFRVISLADLPRIHVRTDAVREIVFDPGHYRRQLARLDYILEHYRRQGTPPGGIERIDLSVSSQVAVRLAASRDVSSSLLTRNLPKPQANRGL
jgi:cell division protein FtsQ